MNIERKIERWKVSDPSSVTCYPRDLEQASESLESQFIIYQ